MESQPRTIASVYKQQPWNIADAYIPDYSKGIVYTPDTLTTRGYREYVASRVQRVLVLGGTHVDCNCSPIFQEAHTEAYLPVWKMGFIDPLQIYRISRRHFRVRPNACLTYPKLSSNDYAQAQEYIQSLYQLAIQKWCKQMYWAYVPISEMVQEQFALKNRPVVEVQPGMYIPTTTRGGTYRTWGPTTEISTKPGRIERVPIYLQRDFLNLKHVATLPRTNKEEIQKYLIANLPNIFQFSE